MFRFSALYLEDSFTKHYYNKHIHKIHSIYVQYTSLEINSCFTVPTARQGFHDRLRMEQVQQKYDN